MSGISLRVDLVGGFAEQMHFLTSKGHTVSEVLREALATYSWAIEQAQNGCEIAAVKPDGLVERSVEGPIMAYFREASGAGGL